MSALQSTRAEQVNKIVDKLIKSKSPKGKQFKANLEKLNDNFLKKSVSYDGTTFTITNQSNGKTAVQTATTAEEVMAILGEFIVKFKSDINLEIISISGNTPKVTACCPTLNAY